MDIFNVGAPQGLLGLIIARKQGAGITRKLRNCKIGQLRALSGQSRNKEVNILQRGERNWARILTL